MKVSSSSRKEDNDRRTSFYHVVMATKRRYSGYWKIYELDGNIFPFPGRRVNLTFYFEELDASDKRNHDSLKLVDLSKVKPKGEM